MSVDVVGGILYGANLLAKPMAIAAPSSALGTVASYGAAAAPKLFGTAIGANMHDFAGLITKPANRLGRQIQKMTLVDSLVATKKGLEGKMYANMKPTGMLGHSLSPEKAIALHEMNTIARNTPMLKHVMHFDKSNKLDVKNMENRLKQIDSVDKGLLATQIGAPAIVGASTYHSERKKGSSRKTALTKSLKTSAVMGAVVSAPLQLPRMLSSNAVKVHRLLESNNRYGYDLLEDAAVGAQKMMNRPRLLNLADRMYVTPEENLKGIGSKLGKGFRTMLGQKAPTKYHETHGFLTDDEEIKESKIKRFVSHQFSNLTGVRA